MLLIDRWAFEREMASDNARDYFYHLVRMSTGDAAQVRAEAFIRHAELLGKCFVGAVTVRDPVTGAIDVHAKVVLPGKGFFMHEEPYNNFPSDHFKTKVLLATGGA